MDSKPLPAKGTSPLVFVGGGVAGLGLILGGALMAEGGPLVAEVRRVVEGIARSPLEIVLSALGKDAPLCGSLLIAVTEARKHVRLRLGEARAAR